jgi:hypothetical protein
VGFTGSFWPDILVGGVLAALFIWTGIGVIREAATVLK